MQNKNSSSYSRYILHINEKRNEPNASSKARNDAEKIAAGCGYELFCFATPGSGNGNIISQIQMIISYQKDWANIYRKVEPGSIVLIQYPLYPLKLTMLARKWLRRIHRKKEVLFIALIHDLDSERNKHGLFAKYADSRFLPEFQYVICHNESMKNLLIRRGLDGEKLIALQLFDYLCEARPGTHTLQEGIAVAGNLNSDKSGYLMDLPLMISSDLTVNLYGSGYKGEKSNFIYHGVLEPDALAGNIKGAFGLVWDGPRADSCVDSAGAYLKINSPHKASLYLASGMPVIVWKRAAIAPIIEKKHLGITVDSLCDIERTVKNIRSEQYDAMVKEVNITGQNIQHGKRLESALHEIERKYQKERI